MNNAEKLLNKKKVYKTEMDKVLPKDQSDKIWKQSAVRLKSILEKYEPVADGMRMHTDKIFTSAAVYLSLKDEIDPDIAYSIMEKSVYESCASAAAKLAAIMKIPGMKSLFVRIWDPLTKKMFGPGNGFKNIFYENKKGEYRMDVVFCPYHRYFTELGCPELTRISCKSDDLVYGNLPGIKFERTGTLGRGNDRCDFYINSGRKPIDLQSMG